MTEQTAIGGLGPLSAGPGQEAAFRSYLDRFNAGDIPGFTAYYHDDVVFDLGVAPPLFGKRAVAEFYDTVFPVIRETVTIDSLTLGPGALNAGISVRFDAYQSAPDFVLGALKAGDAITAGFDVVYRLRDGWVAAVTLTMHTPPTPIERPVKVVTGATGGVGGGAARLLSDADCRLRLVVRDAARAPALGGAEVVQAAYDDAAALARALHAGDHVFMVSIDLPHDPRMALHNGFIEAAARAKVGHIVYLSFLHAGPDAQFLHCHAHGETEALIRRSGLPFTFLRTSFYHEVTGMMHLGGLVLGPAGTGRVSWVSREDCAAAVAAVMRDPASHAGVTYDINGPEALTMAETMALISRIHGVPYRYIDQDYDPDELAKTFGGPAHFLRYRRSALLGIAKGEFAGTTDDLVRLTGRRGIPLEDFIRKHPGAFPHPPNEP